MLFSPPILLGKLLHGDRLVGRGLLLHLVLEVLLAHDLQVHLDGEGERKRCLFKKGWEAGSPYVGLTRIAAS